MFYVYVIKGESSDRYYIGSTKDLALRLTQHNSGMSKSTRSRGPWLLVHSETFDTRADATRRERELIVR